MMSVSGGVYPADSVDGLVLDTVQLPESIQPASEALHSHGVSKSARSHELRGTYWPDQQRIMGISLATEPNSVSDYDYQQMQEEQIQFIKQSFKQKECNRFIPIPHQCGNGTSCRVKELKCYCGEILALHDGMRSWSDDVQFENCNFISSEYAPLFTSPEQILTDDLPMPDVAWNSRDCFVDSETNAFGKIHFSMEQIGGKKPAKYIRLSSQDSVKKCLELMRRYWHFMEPEPPNLVISVVGGAKNFKLSGRSRSIFSTGLIKAAKTTKAWLITSGFNIGVMKSVGQAVHEGQTFQWNNDRMSHVIRCIGIAPWGYVKDRKSLEKNESGNFNVHYNSNSQIEHSQPVPLNPDHTHFIFVDDGYRARYGGATDFRSEFEKLIAQDKKDGGLGIPVVLILVEGGTDAIEDVSASLNQGIPVVVCAGTGRAADIFAYAYNHIVSVNGTQRMSDINRIKLKQKIAQTYKTDDSKLDALTEEVIRSCQKEDLIIFFNMKKHVELDLAILSVLLKAKTNSSRESQLKLAMTWNRADIAQEEIFREDAIWGKGCLEEFLTVALIENKVEFVKLLLHNGIIMHEYLTTQRLETLYNSIQEHSYLYHILETSKSSFDSKTFSVMDIGNFLQKMLDRYDIDEMEVESAGPKLFKSPYKHLLIWAVLTNRNELAHLFLELGEEPIISALICTALCSGMENKVPKYMTIIRNNFNQMKSDFEKLATSVLDECHSNDPDKAIKLVERKSPVWSKLTCLQIAASAFDQEFVASVACQNSIDKIWKSEIMSSWQKVVLCAFCPPLILFFVEMNLKGKKMSKVQKLITFYTAPITKFCLHTTAYVGFLILFTYMLLVDYEEVPSVTEWIALLWIFSFLLGKIHTFIVFPSPTFSGKLRDYFGFLERMDFLNLMLFFCAFCVRWSHVSEGKVIYCVNSVIFYFSVVRMYAANRKLGPKIYMFKIMLMELALFIMILMVFLLAYGVASQGLLYKHRNKTWSILKDIVYFPYWQLFGEIFLEELETDETCTQALQASLNGNSAENTCRTYHWLVPILLALYLLVGNVLLLNLLIAIFSHVFETVEKNAIEIWKSQMYLLVMEFQNRPLLVPPLSLFSHFWLLMKWIYRKISHSKRPKAEQFTNHHLEYLSLFEKEMLANKLRPVRANIINSLDQKFHALQTRMDELTKMIEDDVLSSIQHWSNENRQEAETTNLISQSVKVSGEKYTPPENRQTASNRHIQVLTKSSSSPHKSSTIQISKDQGDSRIEGNSSVISADLVASGSSNIKTLSNLSLESDEYLPPVEENISHTDPFIRLSKSSRRQTTLSFDEILSDTSTDSNSSFKMKSRPHKNDSDYLQSNIESTSYSSYGKQIFQ